jgi:DNA replication protein DnaC
MQTLSMEPQVSTFTIPCTECGQDFESGSVTVGDRVITGQAYCDACLPLVRERIEGKRPADPVHIRAWKSITPVEYQDYDPSKLPEAAIPLRQAGYKWADQGVPRWLLFTGKPGLGKTRIAFQVLKHVAQKGGLMCYTRASQFDKWASSQFQDGSDGAARIAQCHKAKWLLLDDLGKGKLTDRAEAELYDLIEHRNAHRLPLILTSNLPVERLPWCSADRGAAIVGRVLDNARTVA